MIKEIKTKDWHARLSATEYIKIVLLAKLLRVNESEAVRQAVDKMLKEKQNDKR